MSTATIDTISTSTIAPAATSTIKSRPVYGTLVPDPTGRFHIVVGDGGGSAAILRLLADPALPDGPCQVLFTPTPTSSASDLSTLAARANAEILPDIATLLARLRTLLGDCRMGARLYAAGSESFVGMVMSSAAALGMLPDERQGEHAGSAARRVHCTHCRQINTDATTNLVDCAGCGRTLLVRDHYSQRLAAFMGVQADAEQPGAMPELRETFP